MASGSAAAMTQQIEILKATLTARGIPFINDWLTACVDWVFENHSPADLTSPAFILKEVIQQWKDTDLIDLGSQCLPPGLGNVKLSVLNGVYVLQMNSIQDISESAYSQYSKIKKLENENTSVEATDSTEFKASWIPKAKRMLYLTLTDGSQIVYALEMTQIPTLGMDLKPGTKIQIKGPVDCRRGVFHIRPEHITIIGGEVEGLEDYTVEHVLEKRLINIRETEGQDLPDTVTGPTPLTTYTNNAPASSRSRPPPPAPTATTPIHEQVTQPLGTGDDNEFDDDDIFMEIDELGIIEASTQQQQTQSQPPQIQRPTRPQIPPFQSTSPSFHAQSSGAQSQPVQSSAKKPRGRPAATNPKAPKANGKQNGILSYLKKPTPKKMPAAPSAPGTKQPKTKKPKTTTPKDSTSGDNFCSDDDDIFLLDIIDQPSNVSIPATSNNKTVKKSNTARNSTAKKKAGANVILSNSSKPYQYIKQIQLQEFKAGQKVQIKGIVTTLVSNIEVDKGTGNWKLVVNINDGSGYLIVRISEQVLNQMIGFTPSQMKQIKASKAPDSKKRIIDGMSNVSIALVNFSGLMEITISNSQEHVITNLSDITNENVLELTLRTEAIK